MPARFLCHVDEEGRLVPINAPDRLLRLRGKERWVGLYERPALGLRSNAANAYLWSVIYAEIARSTGSDPDSIHYGLKREALRVGVLEPQYVLLGEKLLEDDPTTRTDAETFSKYVDWVKHFAFHDLGITVPEPESHS